MSTATARRDHIQRHIVGASAPAAIEAEKALLGIVLANREALDLIDGLQPAHLYEPLHGRMFGAILSRHAVGSIADPAILDGLFAQDEAYRRNGGLLWLESLIDLAPGISKAEAYAGEIKDAAQRRELLKLADRIDAEVREGEASTPEVIGGAEAALLAMQVSARTMEPVTAGLAAARVLDWLDAPEEVVRGIVTGIPRLDEELGPILPGNVISLVGRTSMGKSTAMEVIGYNIALQGFGFLQISTEMSEDEMAQRHLSDICQRHWGHAAPEYRDIRRRRISVEQRRMLTQAQTELNAAPLVMLKRSGIKLSQIRSIARRFAASLARKGMRLGGVGIDHMGHVKPERPSRDRYADQTEISNGAKELADELQCAVFPALQINRETEKRDDKRPGLSDIRDSGAWEQDSDAVIGWFREAYYAERQTEPKAGAPGSPQANAWAEWDRARRSQTIEALLLKARFGPPRTVKLWGDIGRCAIRDRSPEGDLF